jgi:hypothetical protein
MERHAQELEDALVGLQESLAGREMELQRCRLQVADANRQKEEAKRKFEMGQSILAAVTEERDRLKVLEQVVLKLFAWLSIPYVFC